MTYQIERLEFEELCAFLRLQAEDSFPNLKNEERLKMLAEKWSEYAEFCICRDDDEKLAGMIAFYSNNVLVGFAYIAHVYVTPEYRRHGLFSKMLEKMEVYVSGKGFHEIRLEVGKNNHSAQSAYLRNGFSQEANATTESDYMVKPL